jgi:drug/metabolite transporter (DMT)-like permease
MNKRTFAILMGVFGVILFSAKAVMVKLAYQYEVDALSLLLLRMLFSLPFYLIIALFFLPRNSEPLTKRDYLFLVIFGFLGYYVSSYLDFLGLGFIKASLERIILFVYPTLILIISRIFLRTKIHSWQVLAIAITYVGIFITFWEELSLTSGGSVWIGGGLIFAAAITYATYLVGSGWLIPKFGSIRFTAYAMLVACSFVIVHYLIQNENDLFAFQKEVYYYGIAMALFATVLASFLVSESIKHIGAPNFGIIGSLGPISTIIMANIFLDEKMSVLQIMGTLIVISGVFILARRKEVVNS